MLRNHCRRVSLTPSGSAIQPRGSGSCGGDGGEGFRWIFRSEPNGSTGKPSSYSVYHKKMGQWGRMGRVGQNFLALQIKRLEGAKETRPPGVEGASTPIITSRDQAVVRRACIYPRA